MFTPRQLELLRLVLSYAQANIDDLRETFSTEGDDGEGPELDFNGDLIDTPDDDELSELLDICQS